MDFKNFLKLVGDEPTFDSSLLMAGDVDPAEVRLQLSRWTAAGKIHQVRRGLYSLAPPYQKIKPHPFVIANKMLRASYVSCQSALAFYGLIPEYVPVTVSVTTTHPGRKETSLGVFEFHHIIPQLFHGYRLTDLGSGQQAFVAVPEKALLDLAYLQPGSASPAYLQELRLQNLGRLNLDELNHQAETFSSPKLLRVVKNVTVLIRAEARVYESI
jgi:hypothetical protein